MNNRVIPEFILYLMVYILCGLWVCYFVEKKTPGKKFTDWEVCLFSISFPYFIFYLMICCYRQLKKELNKGDKE